MTPVIRARRHCRSCAPPRAERPSSTPSRRNVMTHIQSHHARTFSTALAAILTAAIARADLRQHEVLILYNHFDAESLAIHDLYVSLHPNVLEFDLAIDYSNPHHQPQNGPEVVECSLPPNYIATYDGDD